MYDIVTAMDLCIDFLMQMGETEPEFGQKENWWRIITLNSGGSVIFACQAAKLGLKTAGIGKVDKLFSRKLFYFRF